MTSIQQLVVVAVFLSLQTVFLINGECPKERDLLMRLPDTRFFIVQKPDTRGNYVGFKDAFKVCESYGLKMGKVKHMLTLAVVGRHLENFVTEKKIKDTFYWLDAAYDKDKENYFWGVNKDDGELQYSNILYRSVRPVGIHGFVDFRDRYQIDSNEPQCLMLSLPWYGPWDNGAKGVIYGHQTMLDERPCSSTQRRHAICESDDEDCTNHSTDAFVLTETKTEYFENGNWIFGDRKFILNWKQRKIDDSRKYCADLGLELLQPDGEEAALIPLIKMWSREITTAQFWTSLRYSRDSKTNEEKYMDASGNVISTKGNFTIKYNESLDARSGKHDKEFCVSLTHAYEFKSQMPCPHDALKGSACSWNFIQYYPVNCENYLGTICQHPDKNARGIFWSATYIKDVDSALNETATIEFGFKGNTETVRSRYKQTFGGLVCPDSFRMLREKNSKWSEKPSATGNDFYKYDYSETYWVVDKGMFDKDVDSMCTVSEPADKEGFSRKLVQVRCDTWHFYLCEKVDRTIKAWVGNINRAEKMIWDKGPQRRPYPITSK